MCAIVLRCAIVNIGSLIRCHANVWENWLVYFLRRNFVLMSQWIMQIIFDINVPILGTLILACPKLVRSEFKTAGNWILGLTVTYAWKQLRFQFNNGILYSSPFSVEHVLVFIRFLAPLFAKRFWYAALIWLTSKISVSAAISLH